MDALRIIVIQMQAEGGKCGAGVLRGKRPGVGKAVLGRVSHLSLRSILPVAGWKIFRTSTHRRDYL